MRTIKEHAFFLFQGRLLCVGSPLALKSEYGSGYSITLSNRRVYDETEGGQYKGKPGKDGSFLPLDVTFQCEFKKMLRFLVWMLVRVANSRIKLFMVKPELPFKCNGMEPLAFTIHDSFQL